MIIGMLCMMLFSDDICMIRIFCMLKKCWLVVGDRYKGGILFCLEGWIDKKWLCVWGVCCFLR